MKRKCILPNGIDLDTMKNYHEKCQICGASLWMTQAFGSGVMFRDGKGELYLSIVKGDAGTALVALTDSGHAIESSNIEWPITRLPEGTILTLKQTED